MTEDFAAAGLGLEYAVLRLVPVRREWGGIADRLAADVRSALSSAAQAVEHVGSTAVPGLLAKPIIDVAIGLRPDALVDEVSEKLSGLGWIYRGDAGEDGGWVFVMEDAPWHRVAHAHAVPYEGDQWKRYITFRDLLRRDPDARRIYEQAKQRLTAQHPNSRADYTEGKGHTVHWLLAADG